MITNAPPDATLTARAIANTNAFRYIRYLSPTNSYGDVAELQFFSSTPTSSSTLAAPSGLTATAGNAQVALSWSSVSGANSYNLKRASVSGGPYTNFASRVATMHMDSGLAMGTYYYVVSAVNDAGESANSAQKSAALTCASPSAPAALSATAETGRLKISWSAVDGATSYNVLRSTTNGGPYASLAVGLNANEFADATIVSGATNYYVVQAGNTCGASANSSQIIVVSLPAPVLTSIMDGNGLYVSWPSWAGNYQLERATNLESPVIWQPDDQIVEYTNGMYLLSVPATNDVGFYRLRSLFP